MIRFIIYLNRVAQISTAALVLLFLCALLGAPLGGLGTLILGILVLIANCLAGFLTFSFVGYCLIKRRSVPKHLWVSSAYLLFFLFVIAPIIVGEGTPGGFEHLAMFFVGGAIVIVLLCIALVWFLCWAIRRIVRRLRRASGEEGIE